MVYPGRQSAPSPGCQQPLNPLISWETEGAFHNAVVPCLAWSLMHHQGDNLAGSKNSLVFHVFPFTMPVEAHRRNNRNWTTYMRAQCQVTDLGIQSRISPIPRTNLRKILRPSPLPSSNTISTSQHLQHRKTKQLAWRWEEWGIFTPFPAVASKVSQFISEHPRAGGALNSKHPICFGGEFLIGLVGFASFKMGKLSPQK